MLCQFSFQNFKSYKEETTLDFQAATLPEFKETLITEEKAADLLPVSVIYGPNGGGKSNLLQALSCVISTIVNPVHEGLPNVDNQMSEPSGSILLWQIPGDTLPTPY